MENNKGEYKVDAQGSLGLLALGDIGVELWRKEVRKAEANRPSKGEDKKSKKDVKKTGK